MARKGTEFFDDDTLFETYMSRRKRADNPNETLEKPVFLELIKDVKDKRVLDLGCGDGVFGSELLNQGCRTYTGLEASSKMVALARQELEGTGALIEQGTIEGWTYPAESFDLVISRLALHYVEDLDQVFRNVHNTLASREAIVFSVLHPVITSCIKSAEKSDRREDWIVDDYFINGPRNVPWMGAHVIQYHRTVEDYFKLLQSNGFVVEHLRESCPIADRFSDKELLQRRMRIPLFLILSGRKR
jgi:SAM-dependent methyltransferase